MSKVIVTGGAGFIGRTIVQKLIELGHEVIVIDNYITGDKEELAKIITPPEPCDFISGKFDELFKDAEYVLHLGALISVPDSQNRPVHYMFVNSVGTSRVITLCKNYGIKKLVFSSSAAVYGDCNVESIPETTLTNPKSIYALTKYDGEQMLSLYPEVKSTALRYFNVFGPGQKLDSGYASVIPKFIDAALKNEPLRIYGTGEQTRDFVYVGDIANANIHMMLNDATGIYNVGNNTSLTINELAQKIITLTNSNSTIEHSEARVGDILHSKADNSKLLSTGFKFEFDFDDALSRTVLYYTQKLLQNK